MQPVTQLWMLHSLSKSAELEADHVKRSKTLRGKAQKTRLPKHRKLDYNYNRSSRRSHPTFSGTSVLHPVLVHNWIALSTVATGVPLALWFRLLGCLLLGFVIDCPFIRHHPPVQRLGLLVLVSPSGLLLALALTRGLSFGHHLLNLFHLGAHGQILLPTDGFSLSPGSLHLGLQGRHRIKADAAVVLMNVSCAPSWQ